MFGPAFVIFQMATLVVTSGQSQDNPSLIAASNNSSLAPNLQESINQLINDTTDLILSSTASSKLIASSVDNTSSISSVDSSPQQFHTNESASTISTALSGGPLNHELIAESRNFANDNDENQDGSDLNFSLMNAPHDRIQAVKNLLNAQKSMSAGSRFQAASSQNSEIQSSMDQHNQYVASLQCTHKGRQYLNGQAVPIEDQPCLNCTCRQAVLQCYLRVCPPVISLESHKRMLNYEPAQKCRMIKDPNQCCPTMRCDLNQSRPSLDSNTVTIDPMRVSSQNEELGIMFVSNRSVNESPTIITTSSTTTPLSTVASYQEDLTANENHLPKLTVISGGNGQRDSILLITSNSNTDHSFATNPMKQSHSSSFAGDTEGSSEKNRANALLDALLETVYSSAAQSNGLNVQGSCMVNGSLYVEGSAVIPEGNAYCQYCYCIRQKIMCIKPKCHLSISGCTPKYNNEYACCPTSYTCTNSETPNSLTINRDHSPMRVSSVQGNLSAKLSAALESLTGRLSSSAQSSSSGDQAMTMIQASGRQQVDRALNQNDNSAATIIALLNSLANETEKSDNQSKQETTAVPSTTSTTTSTTTTSTTTSTTSAPALRKGEAEGREAGDSDRKEDESEPSNEDNSGSNDQEESEDNKEKEREKEKIEQPERSKKKPSARKKDKLAKGGINATSTAADDAKLSAVSDFLEPMKKLGPLVMSPSSPAGCVENGRQYSIGEQIPSLESCKHCYCGIDGVKECKMVECSLKMAHNCKPVTPEGHCCPIRYECPSSRSGSANSVANAVSSRQRADKSGESLNEPSSLAFKDINQCKLGAIDCSTSNGGDSNSTANGAGTNSNGDGLLENIRGLSTFDDIPLFNTTRIVDNGEIVPTTGQPFGNSKVNGTIRALTEDLNKFIMQINGQQNGSSSVSSLSNAGTGYSFSANNDNSSSLTSTQEMMINDQRSRMVDYHTVLAPDNNNSGSPPLPPTGVMGIPSIQPDPPTFQGINNLGRLTNIEIVPIGPSNNLMNSSVEYLTDPTTTATVTNNMRDSRSTNAHTFAPGQNENSIVLVDNHQNLPGIELTTTPDDFVGDSVGLAKRPNSERPHLRLMRHQNSSHSRFRSDPVNVSLSPPMVEFDDDLNSSNRANISGTADTILARPIPVVTIEPQNLSSLLANQFDNSSDSSTPLPPGQPTTGTPIGLDAERGPETRGWLGQLSGIVSNFGKRLVGSNGHELFQGAATDGPTEEQATGRSREQALSPSLFNHLLMSMMGRDESSEQQNSTPNPLVMKPLNGLLQVEGERPRTVANANNRFQVNDIPLRSRAIHSPYEPNNTAASSTNFVEIVTAPVPAEPEVFNHEPMVKPTLIASSEQTSFSRRSDIGTEDELMSEISSSVGTANQSSDLPNPINYQQQQQQQQQPAITIRNIPAPQLNQLKPANNQRVLTCYDSITNRTYQPSEIIPKDNEPCKTCTCILGSELCTTLVCPEKPADDCREERRPGECCPNYLCVNNVAQLTGSNSHDDYVRPAIHQQPSQAGPVDNRAVVIQKLAKLMNNQPQPQMMNRGRSVQQDSGNVRRMQLPQYPIRTSDLSGILPPHLRFRPNNQAINGGGSAMFGIDQLTMDQNKVLFSNPANQKFLTHQTNFKQPSANPNNMILRRNDQVMPALINADNNRLAPFGFNGKEDKNGLFQQSAGSPQTIRPPILSHPPKVQMFENTNKQQFVDPRRIAMNSDSSILNQSAGNVWKQSTPADTQNHFRVSNNMHSQMNNGGALLAPNVLLSRMSGQLSPALSTPENDDSSLPNATPGWLPALSVSQQQNLNTRPEFSTLITTTSTLAPQAPMLQPLPSTSSENSINRVLFAQQQPSQMFGANPIDSGFRPINRPQTLKPSADRQEDQTSLVASSKSEASTQEPQLSTTSKLDILSETVTESQANNMIGQQTGATSAPTNHRQSDGAEMAAAQTPATLSKETGQEASAHNEPTAGSNAPETKEPEVASKQTTTTTESTSEASPSSSSQDSFDLFRVSECNIYGRIYPVGQSIDELSDACKKCTCTSMGVECQNRCR